MMAAQAPRSARPLMAWLVLGLLLLTSTLVSQRSFLMMVQADNTTIATPTSHHTTTHDQTTSNPKSFSSSHNQTPSDPENSSTQHNHAEHCPLCFMYWTTGDWAGDSGSTHTPFRLKKLWLEAAVARDEFLGRIAARGPPDGSS